FDAVVITTAAKSRDPAAYERIYVEGTRRLLAALSRHQAPARRVIFTSSTAVYTVEDGRWVDEDTPVDTASFRSATLLAAEACVRGLGEAGCVLRLGGIYGPERTRLLRQMQAGQVPMPSGPVYTNRMHRDDCAGALRHLLDMPRTQSVYLGVDDEPADKRDILRWLVEAQGAPTPVADPAPPSPGKRCSNTRLRGTGYTLTYPTFREGYAALLHTS
ncbi:MAG TPA: NAD-dependent epimerase/dehydratase family protein, partial [Myxococcota bacterium]|nr:NAD-dependent epimerase/dehydratase family protein [Myxococcota bacterium]